MFSLIFLCRFIKVIKFLFVQDDVDTFALLVLLVSAIMQPPCHTTYYYSEWEELPAISCFLLPFYTLSLFIIISNEGQKSFNKVDIAIYYIVQLIYDNYTSHIIYKLVPWRSYSSAWTKGLVSPAVATQAMLARCLWWAGTPSLWRTL